MQPGEGGSLEIHLKEDTHIYTAKEHKPNERTNDLPGRLPDLSSSQSREGKNVSFWFIDQESCAGGGCLSQKIWNSTFVYENRLNIVLSE